MKNENAFKHMFVYFKGVLLSTPTTTPDHNTLKRLWVHEVRHTPLLTDSKVEYTKTTLLHISTNQHQISVNLFGLKFATRNWSTT
jgi:hypothetical protein